MQSPCIGVLSRSFTHTLESLAAMLQLPCIRLYTTYRKRALVDIFTLFGEQNLIERFIKIVFIVHGLTDLAVFKQVTIEQFCDSGYGIT
jgi:hypothetical protein